MKKILFLLFTSSLACILNRQVMADTNMVRYSGTTHANTHALNGYDNGGIPTNAYDENFSTAYGSNNSRSDGGFDLYVISEHNFPSAVTLNKISYRLLASCGANGKYTRTRNLYLYIEYKSGGAWYQLPGSRVDTGGGEGDSGYDTGQINYVAPLANVQGLRATVHSFGLATGGEGRAYAHGWIYEMQGWAVVDVGLRAYDGKEIVKIACEPAGVQTSPLKINKNGTNYVMVLVETSDARASRIRIKTSSGIKALVKIN